MEEMAQSKREKRLRYMGKAGSDLPKVSTTAAKGDSGKLRASESNPAVRGVHLKNRMR